MQRVYNTATTRGRIREAIDDGLKMAGRYAANPAVQTTALGLAGAGASVLGNAVTGQLDQKPTERILAEALGAGALGAGAGYLAGNLQRKMQPNVREYEDLLNVINQERVRMAKDAVSNGATDPATQQAFQQLGNVARMTNVAINSVRLMPPVASLAAAGLGGAVAGGLSNLMSVPQTIDNPEAYQGSNSPGAMQYYERAVSQMIPNTPVLF